jgi:tetratricopeptide (TPR) repeat protein
MALQLFERYDRERTKPAYEEARVAAALNLNRGQTHLAISNGLLYLDRSAEAVPHLREGVKHLPAVALAWGSLGVALNHAGSFEESTEAFAKAVTLDQNYFEGPQSRQREIWRASERRQRYK